MRVTLQVKSGPAGGKPIHLQTGQTASVGRTEWADFCFPRDDRLADTHFAIENRPDGCRIRDLHTEAGTLVNGQPVAEAVLHTGDLIVAGQTTWLVSVEGEPARPVTPDAAAAPEVSPAPTPVESAAAPPRTVSRREQSPSELYTYLNLDDPEAQELAARARTGDAYVILLAERGKYPAAIRVQAWLLPPRQAVWWACLCVQELLPRALSEPEAAALDVARRWVAEPTDEHRRAAEKAAASLEHQGPAAWVANAAFWSGGSLTPPGEQEAVADERLTSQAILVALTATALAARPDRPEAVGQKYQDFLARAKNIAAERIPLPLGATSR